MYVSTKGVVLESSDYGNSDIVAIYINDIIECEFDNGKVKGGVVSISTDTVTLNTSSEIFGTKLVKIEFALIDKITVVESRHIPTEDDDSSEDGSDDSTDQDGTATDESTTEDTTP